MIINASLLRFAGFCLIAAAAFGFRQNPRLELQLGQRVETTISGPSPHVYAFAVQAGQFFKIAVENEAGQAKNPLRFTLRSSEASNLSQADEISIIKGRGRISWISERGGNYELEVRRVPRAYWTSDPQASYALQIVEIRDSKVTDRNIVAGEKDIREDKYSDAVEKFRIAGDPAGLAESLEQLAGTITGQAQLDALLEALAIADRSSDGKRKTDDLLQIAAYYEANGDFQTSLNYSYESLYAGQKARYPLGQGGALVQIAGLYQDLGDPITALQIFNRALEANTDTKAPRITTNALAGIAAAYAALGDDPKALEYRVRTVDFVHNSGNRNIEALQRNQLAAAYSSIGQYDRALDQLNLAMDLYRADNHGAGQMRTFIGLGNVYIARHDSIKAEEAFRNAMQIEMGYTFPDGPEHSGPMRIGMGEALLLDGNRQGALDFFKQALEVCRQLHDWRCEAEALRRIAGVESNSGDFQNALKTMRAAIDIIESVRGRIAGPAFRATYSASKRAFYESYIDLLLGAQSDVAAFEASEQFRMRSFVEMLSESAVDVRQGVDSRLIEQENTVARQINNQQRVLIGLSADKARATAARETEQRLNDLLLKYQEVEANIRAQSPAYASLIHPTPLSLGEIQRLLDPETLLLEYWLGENSGYIWVIGKDSIAAYRTPARERVEKAAERFYDLLTARAPRGGESPAQRQARIAKADAQYGESAAALSRMLLGPVAADLAKKRLLIVPDGALHYVPFASLPIATPPQDGRSECGQTGCLLVNEHEVVMLPSASVFAALRERNARRATPSKTAAVFADPVFDKDDSRVHSKTIPTAAVPALLSPRYLEHELKDVGVSAALPRLIGSRHEAAVIASSDSSHRVMQFLDFSASRERVLNGGLDDFRIVHFATHGFVDNTHPELSGLALSLVDPKGVPRDGYLRLHDIYNLRLPVDLVVLSACNTALGKRLDGEGLIGLTRGFIYAGAQRVMATLWKVDDEAAAEEMGKLYQQLLAGGKTPAAGLRDAQLQMLKSPRWRSPYYWSAFTLQGDW